jgi:hypothetical protein
MRAKELRIGECNDEREGDLLPPLTQFGVPTLVSRATAAVSMRSMFEISALNSGASFNAW